MPLQPFLVIILGLLACFLAGGLVALWVNGNPEGRAGGARVAGMVILSTAFFVMMSFGVVPIARWAVEGYFMPFMRSLPMVWTDAFLVLVGIGGVWAVWYDRRERRRQSRLNAPDDYA